MNANSTSTFPPTVKRMQAAKHSAINTVCHASNGGRTGTGPSVVVRKSVSMRVSLKSWKKSSDPLKYGKPITLLLLARNHWVIVCSLRSDCRLSSNWEHGWWFRKRFKTDLQSVSRRSCFFFIFLQIENKNQRELALFYDLCCVWSIKWKLYFHVMRARVTWI